MKTLSIILLTCFLFTSCINKKYIIRGNNLYTFKKGQSDAIPPVLKDAMTLYRVKKGFKAKLKEDDGRLFATLDKDKFQAFFEIKKVDTTNIHEYLPYRSTVPYFPDTANIEGITPRGTFRYLDSRPVLQALTIPLKIRPALSSTILEEASTKLDLGVGFGWKFNYNVFRPEKDIFGSTVNTFSLSPGIFLGPAAALIDKTTTSPVVDFKRNAALVQTGTFLTVGYNKFNIGFLLGVDHATGPGRKEWIYQGKLWWGLIFSYDLIK